MRDDTDRSRDGKDPSASRHLRLIHPSPPTPPKRAHKGRPPVFSREESARVRAALRHARAMFGTWSCVADAMYDTEQRVRRAASGERPISADIAVRLARALGVPLESLYRAPTDASRCPHCGRVGPS